MKNKIKLLIFTAVIAISILACSALTGNDTNNNANTENDTQTEANADILFEDNFSSTSSGWDQYSDDVGVTDYEDGAYKIGIYTDSYFYWANPYQNFGDVIVEVETEKISGGDDMQYGVICRYLDIDNWYALVISADGYATVRKRYQGGDLEYLTDWAYVDAIKQGDSKNDLRVECVGSQLSLYVNGTLAIEATDADIASGDVGLMAGTFEQSSTEVLFDDFVVRKP